MSYIGNTPTQQNFVAGADQFSGTGSQTAFTLSRNVNTVFDIFITVSNVPQDPFTAYTVSGNTLTFDSAPPSGTGNIDVVYRATNVQTFVPTQGVSPSFGNLTYTGTLTGGTGVVNLGSGQVYKDASGNVGIGTSSPAALLHAYGNIRSATNGNVLELGTDTDLGFVYNRSNGSLTFGTNNSERARVDSSGNVGVNSTNPSQYATSGKILNITGTANNSGPANLFMPGASSQPGAGFASTEVFAISSVSASQEITRVTGTGTNGFRAYIKVIVTGHTGGVGNGINIKEWFWDGGTGGVTQISTYTNGQVPSLSVTNSTNNVLIINLASSNGSSAFNGVMKVEWMIPIDFSSSTYTIS